MKTAVCNSSSLSYLHHAAVCPVLCHGNGDYVRGACECYPGWKGAECSLAASECLDPSCSGSGKCVGGLCVCAPGFKGDSCEHGTSFTHLMSRARRQDYRFFVLLMV